MKQSCIVPIVLILIVLLTCIPSKGDAVDRLKLSALIEEALAVNPRIRGAQAAWEAKKARINQVNVLADPEIGFDTWNIPNTLDLSETRNWIFFAKQRFPAKGTLDLRADVAKTMALQSEASIELARRAIVSQVKIAYADLYLAHKTIAVNDAHIEILKQFEAFAEIKYQTGAGSEQDVLKTRVALSRLENKKLRLNQRRHRAGAALNTLLKRAPDAPLKQPEALSLIDLPEEIHVLENKALSTRPELKVAKVAIEGRKQEIALAKLKLKPDYQVSVKRFQNHGAAQSSGWGVSASINVPWFSHGKHDLRIEEIQHIKTQDEAQYERLKDQTRFMLSDLIVKIQTATQSATLFQEKIIPQAEESVTSAETGYQNDQVDFLDLLESQRTLIDFRLEYLRALTLQNQEVARLEQVMGSDLAEFNNDISGDLQ